METQRTRKWFLIGRNKARTAVLCGRAQFRLRQGQGCDLTARKPDNQKKRRAGSTSDT